MKIRNPILIEAGSWLVIQFVKLLALTLRTKNHLAVPGADPAHPQCDRCYLYPIWHENIVMPLALRGSHNISALVSRHQDGGFLVSAIKHLGIRCIRGSSSRGGALALRELIKTAGGMNVVITPDGPRGPRRRLKSGIVFLASQTGIPIVPATFACDRAWTIRGNWTDLVIPKPFSTVHIIVGAPLDVPPNLSRNQLAVYQDQLQQEMERLDAQAERIVSGQEPETRQQVAA